jgi:hypothetical protein
MMTEDDGPASPGLEERLSRRFAAELDRAGRDYPTIGGRAEGGAGRRSGRLPGWPRAALALLAVGVLAAGGLVGVGLFMRPGNGGPAAAGPGADGVPNEIDGRTVYRVGDPASWQDRGDFLLAGYVVQDITVCADRGLASLAPVPECDGLGLGPTATSKAALLDIAIQYGYPEPLSGWLGAGVVVHAKGCISYVDPIPTRCPSVIDSVVWPVVPDQIDGEHVYRAADQASFAALTGSFLLGGRVSKPDIMPPCPMPLNKSDAETQLIPYCYWLSIDGLAISPKGTFDEPKNEIVVARVHVNDPLAAQCPADSLAACQAAIVVESVVWRSNPYGTASSSPNEATLPPAGESASAAPNPAQSAAPPPSPAALPSSAAVPTMSQLDPDGVPVMIDGQIVSRATNLPSTQTYLLGGRLTRDTSCPIGEPTPDPNTAKPPACGFWMIDGIKVGAQTAIRLDLEGSLIVAQVTASRTLAVCVTTPCPPASVLVVTDVVWSGPPVATQS